MEDKKKGGGVETTTLAPLPMESRKSWLDVALIQAGIMICVPSLLLGGMLAQAMSLRNAIISGTIGYLIVILLFSLMGMIGSDIGRPTCVTAIGGFGRKGTRYIISPIDAPPVGQDAKSHTDGICLNSTVWLDDVMLMNEGQIVDKELLELSPVK